MCDVTIFVVLTKVKRFINAMYKIHGTTVVHERKDDEENSSVD